MWGRRTGPNAPHRGAMTAGSQGIDALDQFPLERRRGATFACVIHGTWHHPASLNPPLTLSACARILVSSMTDKSPAPIVAAEGWHVLHLFYKVEQGAWSLLS